MAEPSAETIVRYEPDERPPIAPTLGAGLQAVRTVKIGHAWRLRMHRPGARALPGSPPPRTRQQACAQWKCSRMAAAGGCTGAGARNAGHVAVDEDGQSEPHLATARFGVPARCAARYARPPRPEPIAVSRDYRMYWS